jgi:glycosyltransferase involved in cell wall biosynthesis
MKVLIVSGIWPPDVGGPASHAPELAAYLLEHGHQPVAVVTADTAPPSAPHEVAWVSRSSPLRHARAAALIHRLARNADVVYSTGMFGRTGLGAGSARTPYVVKLTADPAFERARRLGLTRVGLAEFQQERSPVTLPLRVARNEIARHAAAVVTPSAYLGELARAWGARSVALLPNPAPATEGLPSRDEARRSFGFDGPTLAFAGRLTAQKNLPLAIEAARDAGVGLVIAGDGAERESLERLGQTRFLGALSRQRVLELFRAADATVLSSSWENFPHSVVESLAVGTPVVATDVGGVGEVLRDDVNGLLVAPNDPLALAGALGRLFGEPGLLDRLSSAAAPSVADYSRDRVYGRLVELLLAAANN